jgi:hypothetical protein
MPGRPRSSCRCAAGQERIRAGEIVQKKQLTGMNGKLAARRTLALGGCMVRK